MEINKIKWGIMGTGSIAHSFAQDFRFATGGVLKAVASRSLSTAQAFASQYGLAKAYESYEALVADSEIDVVYIATPHSFHFENARAALEAGKAVLCEKPLTVSYAECEALTAVAKSQNVYLMEAMWTYFLPAIKKAQEWVAEGRIGRLVQIKADFGFPAHYDPTGRLYNPALAGGAMLDIGIYPVAMAWLFFQQDPTEIKAVSFLAPTGVDEEVHMLLEYGDEVANLACSFRSKLFNHLFIIGTEGLIQIPRFWEAKDAYLFHLEEQIDHFHDDRSSLGFHYEINAVNQDLMEGRRESTVVPHATSLKFQSHMEQILKCASEH